ncbi:hypothetical protein B0H63DRAFT_546677 [Podospora didyma]|uniref:Uncharacterized protein n=1 Tax=Podospora didyma TaxID=330526 RepID=A0AAE0NI85_9PEZI|nr:hypothetical protein B0H63DRAFT_546677 [Podospora didyma]
MPSSASALVALAAAHSSDVSIRSTTGTAYVLLGYVALVVSLVILSFVGTGIIVYTRVYGPDFMSFAIGLGPSYTFGLCVSWVIEWLISCCSPRTRPGFRLDDEFELEDR